MNYRHAFHAGNFADVHKHVALLALLRHLHAKPAPFFFIDTHAGSGNYDLRTDDATRGGESQHGIQRVFDNAALSEELLPYLAIVKQVQAGASSTVQHYPGSPLFAMAMLRENDRAVFVEKNAAEAFALKETLQGFKRVAVLAQDGYAALKAHVPPKENRGLVFIDPPYETDTEFADIDAALQLCLQRWANGMYCIWYPIKVGGAAQRWQQRVIKSGIKKILSLELTIRPSDSPLGLNGSGLLIVNPPWKFAEEMRTLQPKLHQALAIDHAGGSQVKWLAGE